MEKDSSLEPTVLWRKTRPDGHLGPATAIPTLNRCTVAWHLDDTFVGARDVPDLAAAIAFGDEVLTAFLRA
jgi:hypothetical protein